MRQGGFAAVIAVAFIVILAALGTYALRTSAVAHLSTALSWYGMQTWFAARSGTEWALDRATRSQASHDAICASPPITTSYPVTLAGEAFAIEVRCDDHGGFTEAGKDYEVDALVVTARHGSPGDIDYALRTIDATVTRGGPLP